MMTWIFSHCLHNHWWMKHSLANKDVDGNDLAARFIFEKGEKVFEIGEFFGVPH